MWQCSVLSTTYSLLRVIMKKLILIFLATTLFGCSKPTNQWRLSDADDNTGTISNIKGLEDCVYYSVFTGETSLHIVRCPQSTTSVNYRCGKAKCNTINDNN